MGRILRRAFAESDDEVIVLTRRPEIAGETGWDGETHGPWCQALEGCDVLILKSRRVIPERLLQSGFEFRFPNWEEAAKELCSRRAAAQLQPTAPTIPAGV